MSFKVPQGASGSPHRPVSNTGSPSIPSKVQTPPTGTPTPDSTVTFVLPNPQFAERYLTHEGVLSVQLLEIPTFRSFALTQEHSAVASNDAFAARAMTEEELATAASEYAQILVGQLTQEESNPTLETNPRFLLAQLTEEGSIASSMTTVPGVLGLTATHVFAESATGAAGASFTGSSFALAGNRTHIVFVQPVTGGGVAKTVSGFGLTWNAMYPGSNFSGAKIFWAAGSTAVSTGKLTIGLSAAGSTRVGYLVDSFTGLDSRMPLFQSTDRHNVFGSTNPVSTAPAIGFRNQAEVRYGVYRGSSVNLAVATTGSGFNELASTSFSTFSRVHSEWSSAADSSVSWSVPSAVSTGAQTMLAAELVESPGKVWITRLLEESTVSATTAWVTSTMTAQANAPVFVAVVSISSVTGCTGFGVSFTRVAVTTGSGSQLSVWKGEPAARSSGSIQIRRATTVGNVIMIAHQAFGLDTANPIVQSTFGRTSSTSQLTFSLSPLSNSSNVTYGCAYGFGVSTLTPGAGFRVVQEPLGLPVQVQLSTAGSTSVGWTYSASPSTAAMGIAMELQKA